MVVLNERCSHAAILVDVGPIGLDDIHCLRALKEAAESYDISPALEWLDSTWLI